MKFDDTEKMLGIFIVCAVALAMGTIIVKNVKPEPRIKLCAITWESLPDTYSPNQKVMMLLTYCETDSVFDDCILAKGKSPKNSEDWLEDVMTCTN